MKVEREGGAISLELERALGTISTGAAKTAAELALVRLEKEREECKRRLVELPKQEESELSDADAGLWATQSRLADVYGVEFLDVSNVASDATRRSWLREEICRLQQRQLTDGPRILLMLLGAPVAAAASAWVMSSLGGGFCETPVTARKSAFPGGPDPSKSGVERG